MEDHKTKKVIIKEADVDIDISPVVEWLNKFKDVFTLFSCQGGEKSNSYVLFCCMDNLTLIKILKITNTFADVKVDFYEGVTRYYLEFHSYKKLTEFYSWIK